MARSASGSGTIRKKSKVVNGKTYTWWEARYTVGTNPGTGKQIQKSVSGKTQKEVAQKLKAATAAIDAGTYTEPSKMTVGEWLDIWAEQYLGNVKVLTVSAYKTTIRLHIKPQIGAVKLEKLNAHTVQRLYNSLGEARSDGEQLSPKTIKNVHGVLHRALQQAVANGYIKFNPAGACVLPRVEKKELKPLDEVDTTRFLEAIQGHQMEILFTVTLFTGMREGEVLGLTWDCVDFNRGTIVINKQLQKEKKAGAQYFLAPTKNDKARSLTPAPFVMDLLCRRKDEQEADRKAAGEWWSNPMNLVFTNNAGGNLIPQTVSRKYKEIVTSIGRPDARFHDLRHSYAVAAIRSGDDIKTVQGNLGHATASFTLDVYGHVTDQMKEASAARMTQYINCIRENVREKENTTP
jgi:integrase